MQYKIIFLDIDGPMIGTPQHCIDSSASNKRSIMNTNAIGWINTICLTVNAKIVTNSAHNYYNINSKTNLLFTDDETGEDLKTSLIKHGIKEEYFYSPWRIDFYKDTFDREKGYKDFVEKYHIKEYVIFDDMNFTKDKNLILIPFEDGISFEHYKKALHIFGIER